MRKLGRLILVAIVLALGAALAQAGNGSLTVGKPTKNGTLDVGVNIPGIEPSGADGSGSVVVHVAGILATDSAADKAVKVAQAINVKYGAPPNVATIDPANPSKINLSYKGKAGTAWVPKNGDKTGEGKLLAQVDVPARPLVGLIDFDTGLSGLDAGGLASTFSAAFGYDGYSKSATLAYGDLADPTIDGLMAELFAALNAGLSPDVSMVLDDGELRIALPTGRQDYFVQVESTDTLAGLSGGLGVAVPEPASLALAAAALALMATAGRRRRRSPHHPA